MKTSLKHVKIVANNELKQSSLNHVEKTSLNPVKKKRAGIKSDTYADFCNMQRLTEIYKEKKIQVEKKQHLYS